MVQEEEKKITKDICEICDLTELAREIVEVSKEVYPGALSKTSNTT